MDIHISFILYQVALVNVVQSNMSGKEEWDGYQVVTKLKYIVLTRPFMNEVILLKTKKCCNRYNNT